ncbi:MAG TPA: ABC transporter permease, partial [bacterium]|nr:ABC transporter permease [bacterium]
MFSSLPIALRAIAANRLRSGLTMLGVMIGIAAVIALQAIGQGQRAAQMEIYEVMGANKLMVFPGWGRRGGVSGASESLELEDAAAILEIRSIANVSPLTGVQGRIKYMANAVQTQVV